MLRFVAWSAIVAYRPNPYYEGLEETEEMKGLLEWKRASGNLDATGIAWGLDVCKHVVDDANNQLKHDFWQSQISFEE